MSGENAGPHKCPAVGRAKPGVQQQPQAHLLLPVSELAAARDQLFQAVSSKGSMAGLQGLNPAEAFWLGLSALSLALVLVGAGYQSAGLGTRACGDLWSANIASRGSKLSIGEPAGAGWAEG